MEYEMVKSVFGDTIPNGATSFSTRNGVATFCVGATGDLVNVLMSIEQERKLIKLNMAGTFGIEI